MNKVLQKFNKLNINDFVLGTSFIFKGGIENTENTIKELLKR